jgi:hypothetical protein
MLGGVVECELRPNRPIVIEIARANFHARGRGYAQHVFNTVSGTYNRVFLHQLCTRGEQPPNGARELRPLYGRRALPARRRGQARHAQCLTDY